jgi:DNA (cytosine-5)-methyltransferase 1
MKQIHIKLDDNTHKRLVKKVKRKKTTIQEHTKDLILKDLQDGVTNGKFTYIDLFSGIGGIRIPFDELGGRCILSSEIDKYAKKTYEAYHGDIVSGDVSEIDPKSVANVDILLAGFPCQPFSQAGHKKGFDDTRGTLFFEILKFLMHKQNRPKAFLLENVKGLKGHDKGNTFKVIKKSIEEAGYYMKTTTLKAKDFGLPQNRERFFLVGFLDKRAYDRFEFPKPLNIDVKLGDILQKKVDEKYTISDRLWHGHQRRKKEHKLKGNGFGYSLFNANSPYTSTLSARYYKDGSEILIEQKGKNPRKITPLEAARLQGFPEDIVKKAYQAGVSDTQLYKQFGNAVPVNVIREIAKNMIKALEL